MMLSFAKALRRPLQRTTYLLSNSFSAITIAQIKELRNITGSPIDECKKALEAEQGDLEKARDYLKRRGLAQAQKKSGRSASEGVVALKLTSDDNTALVAEVNCETDFVAKNDIFIRYVDLLLTSLTRHADLPSIQFKTYNAETEENINDILKTPLNEKALIEGHECSDLFEAKQLTTSKLQENIKVRKLFAFSRTTQDSAIGHYLHMTLANGVGKSCCLVDLECKTQNRELLVQVANNIAMQVLASRPEYVNKEDIPVEKLNEEREKIKEVLKETVKNKPENVIEKMVDGKLKKFFEDSVLLQQDYMLDNDGKMTVTEYLKQQEKTLGGPIKINKFQIVDIDSEITK